MVDFIYKHGMKTESVFLTPGDTKLKDHIRICLDTGMAFDMDGAEELNVYSMAETLLNFLEALPEPVIPFALYQKCLDAHAAYHQAKQVESMMIHVNLEMHIYHCSYGVGVAAVTLDPL